jgi:putative oxidoreductase
MWKKLVWTDGNTTGLVLRLALGIVIFPHGAQKLLGWFGGGGVSGTMGFFETLGIPALLTWLVILAEFFGSLALLAGFLTRLCAAGIGCVMLGAIYHVHWENGFFMGDGGFEYHLLALGVVLALLITGGGRASVDQALSRRKA